MAYAGLRGLPSLLRGGGAALVLLFALARQLHAANRRDLILDLVLDRDVHARVLHPVRHLRARGRNPRLRRHTNHTQNRSTASGQRASHAFAVREWLLSRTALASTPPTDCSTMRA